VNPYGKDAEWVWFPILLIGICVVVAILIIAGGN
jgi:hypothetical protein